MKSKDIDDLVVEQIHSLVEVVNKDKANLEAQKITTVAHLILDLKPTIPFPTFLNMVEEAVYGLDQLQRKGK